MDTKLSISGYKITSRFVTHSYLTMYDMHFRIFSLKDAEPLRLDKVTVL